MKIDLSGAQNGGYNRLQVFFHLFDGCEQPGQTDGDQKIWVSLKMWYTMVYPQNKHMKGDKDE